MRDRARGAWARARIGCAVVLLAATAACTRDRFAEPATTVPEAGPPDRAAATLPVIPEAVPTGATLLDERFTGAAGGEWSHVVGWTRVGYGGGTSWSASGPAFAWHTAGEGWVDYAVAVEGRIDAGALTIGVRAGPAGRYVVHAATTEVTLLREAPWGAFRVLAAAPPLEVGRSHSVSVAVVGGHLQVWSDGRLVLEHSDLDALPAGTVTLGAREGSVVSVDGVHVSGLGAGLPPVKPANGGAEPVALDGRPDAAPPGGPGDAEPEEAYEPEDGNDLELGLVRFDRPTYSVGDPVTVEVAVALEGEGPVGPFSVRFDIGETGCEATVQSLSNFGTTTAACTTPGIGQSGLSVWHVQVDDRSQVAEPDEEDNAAVGTLAVGAAGGDTEPADLVAMWWSTDPWPPDGAELVDLQVRVGPLAPFDGSLPPYVVAISLDAVVLCNIEVASSVPTTLICPLEAGVEAGRHVLGVVIDATGVVDEGPGEAENTLEFVVDL